MVDMGGRYADNLKECSDKSKVVIDEVKSR